MNCYVCENEKLQQYLTFYCYRKENGTFTTQRTGIPLEPGVNGQNKGMETNAVKWDQLKGWVIPALWSAGSVRA